MVELDVNSISQKNCGQLTGHSNVGYCIDFVTLHILTFLVTQLTRSLGLFALARLAVVVRVAQVTILMFILLSLLVTIIARTVRLDFSPNQVQVVRLVTPRLVSEQHIHNRGSEVTQVRETPQHISDLDSSTYL